MFRFSSPELANFFFPKLKEKSFIFIDYSLFSGISKFNALYIDFLEHILE